MDIKNQNSRTFECSICGKKLSSSVALACHLKTHAGIKSFCCEHCGALYSTKQNLKAHLLRAHDISGDSVKSCDICGKKFFRKCAFDSHYLIHLQQKPFCCHICSKHFRQKITRDLHIATHTGDYKYSCSYCGKKFISSYKHKQHMEKKKGLCSDLLSKPRYDDFLLYGDEVVNPFELDERVPDKLLTSTCFNQDQEEAIQYFCEMPQCSDRSYNNKTLLRKHISRAHLNRNIGQNEGIPYEAISYNNGIITSDKAKDQTVGERNSKSHSGKSSNSSKLFCPECSKQFKSLQGLEYHKKAHKGFYNFICEICGKLFIRNSHFVSHMKTHSDMRPYCCSLCRKSYKSKKNLKEHIRCKHLAG